MNMVDEYILFLQL